MKRASAHLRKGNVLIQAFSQTTTGLWIGYGPVYVVSSEDNPVEIGAKVLAALANSISGVRHPSQDEWKSVQTPLLEAASVKSWATFEKGALGVGLDDQGDFIAITPTVNDANGGKDLPDKVVHSEKNNLKLGEALLQAFAVCE